MLDYVAGVLTGIGWLAALEVAFVLVWYFTNRKGTDGMPLNLSVVRKKTLPAKAEYMDSLIKVDFRPGIITPAWSTELNEANTSSADDFVAKIVEVVKAWDLEENPETPFAPESKYWVGDLLLADQSNGRAYRVMEITPHVQITGEGVDREETVMDFGMSNGVPDEWPQSKGDRVESGGVVLECIGADDEAYTIPLTTHAVAQVPGPVLGQIVSGVMSAANTGAEEQKRG